jgi:hypothetical protein
VDCDQGFDPVRHMLEHLPAESSDLNQQYFDTQVHGSLLGNVGIIEEAKMCPEKFDVLDMQSFISHDINT